MVLWTFLLLSSLICSCESLLKSSKWSNSRIASRIGAKQAFRHDGLLTLQASATGKLLPDPLPESIGNFFDNSTESLSFIQCYMLALTEIDKVDYGVGFPVDMPVMLGYFDGNELKAVDADYPDYDHLLNHVTVQMDSNECQLYKTPVVLTLQGDLDDEDEEEEDEYEEYEDGDEEEELTIDEILAMEDEDDEDYEDDEDDEDMDDEDMDDDDMDDDGDYDSFMRESPAGKMSEADMAAPDVTLFRPEGDAASDIPADAIVTEEDTRSLQKAHRRADRIIQYASDIKLIASFHYKKKNYHLLKLLDPIFVVGKRIHDIKGYYFSLLDQEESERVTPVMEKLLTERSQNAPPPNNDNNKDSRRKESSDNNKNSGRTRRSWRDRKKN